MKIETLITTVDLQDADALLARMNISGNYLIGNQCDREAVQKREKGLILSTCTRGVGRNRNGLLARATGDILLLADDDMRFRDDYEAVAAQTFRDYPRADVLVFNFLEESPGRRVIRRAHPVRWHNYMNYGAARLAIRRESIAYRAISFSPCFGGGTDHGSGEDTLFLNACLRAGLRVVAVPQALARLTEERHSTWFRGYDEKFFFDKGALLQLAHPRLGKWLALGLVLKNRALRRAMPLRKSMKATLAGAKYVRKAGWKNGEN